MWEVSTLMHFRGQMSLSTTMFEMTGHPLCGGGMLVQEGGVIKLP